MDPAARRKLQNRLNQRARRERKALEAEKKDSNKRWVVYTGDAIAKRRATLAPKSSQSSSTEMSQQKVCGSICEPRTTQDIPVSELHLRALHWINNPTLTPNPSFCAAQYNLLIATFANAQLMGLTLDLLQEDLASQFNLVGPSSLHLPPTLWPSKLQRKVLHHPWIDLLPMSSMREGILSRLDTIDEDEACGDIFGICSSSGDSGLLVWGEAWDPLAYEASPDLIRKWFWIAKECPDVIRSTNYWRRRRGEKALVIEEE